MRLKRAKKDYGGGSGHEIFESDLFRVTLWKSKGGENTRMEYGRLGYDYEIAFDGHHYLISDEDCMEQLNITDIKKMIKAEKKISYEEGQAAKIAEIKKCFI